METEKKTAGWRSEQNPSAHIISFLTQIKTFFLALYGENPFGWLTLWTKQDKCTRYFDLEHLNEFVSEAIELQANKDVYFGIGLRKEQPMDPMSRGDAKSVLAIPGLWMEIDYLSSNHAATNLPQRLEVAHLLKGAFPLNPSLIIHTGGGFLYIWLTDELFIINNDKVREYASTLQKRLHSVVNNAAQEKGWRIDNISDLSRVVRVPFTLNHKPAKYGKEPQKVELLAMKSDRRYTIKELEEAISVAEATFPLERLASYRVDSTPRMVGDYPPSYADKILKNCRWLQRCRDDAATLPEPEWMSMLPIIARTVEGPSLCHELSKTYPEYSAKETEYKIERAMTQTGPTTCAKIKQDFGVWCLGCQHNVTSPIILGLDSYQTSGIQINENSPKVVEPPMSHSAIEGTDMRAGDTLYDCPFPNLLIPAPYSISDEGIFKNFTRNSGKKNENNSDLEVAMAPVGITNFFRNMNNETHSLELAWKHGFGWTKTIVERDVISSSGKIVDLSKFGFPVTSVNAKEMVKYLTALEDANLKLLPSTLTSNQLGWQGKDGSHGFLCGRTLITAKSNENDGLNKDHTSSVSFKGLDDGDEQLADGFHQKGTIENWLDAVTIASRYPKVMIGFYTAFVPAILNILNCKNFVLEYAKRTSTGKSASQRLAASVIGNPDERSTNSVFHTWGASKVWIGSASAVLNGMPLILDDTKQAIDNEFVAQVIYMVTAGKDKARGSIKGTRVTLPFKTVLISSGEVPSTSLTKDGGTKGRVLTITTLPFDGDGPEEKKAVEQINRIVMQNYGYALPLFVQWVVDNRDKWIDWEIRYRQLVIQYASSVSNNVAGRLADYVAAITLTASLVHIAFQEAKHPLPHNFSDPFRNGFWEEIAKESDDAIGAEDSLRDLFAWVKNNETSFYGRHQIDAGGCTRVPSGGWLGRWDIDGWQYLAIDTSQLKRWIRNNNYNAEEILGHWRDNGWLVFDKGYAKQVRCDQERIYMVCITRTALESP